MTRITISELKGAVRSPSSRRPAPGDRGFATPLPMAYSAVRRYHSDGAEASAEYLREAIQGSTYWSGNSWAQRLIGYFDNYVALSSGDDRPWLGSTLKADVPVGVDREVGITLDVVLLDPAGYVARLPLWDATIPDESEIDLLSAPLVAGVDQALGDGRCARAEVWHLPSATPYASDREAALAQLDAVDAIVARYTDSG